MLRIIAGMEDADSGSVVFRNGLRVGFLEQLPPLDPDLTVLEACMSEDHHITSVISDYERRTGFR